MVQSVNRDAYRGQVHALLPAGRAWPEEAGTTLDATWCRRSRRRLSGRGSLGREPADEVRPDTTFGPAARLGAGPGPAGRLFGCRSDVTTRRASVLALLVSQPTLHPSQYIAIAARYGVVITIDELNQTRADAIPGLDTSGGKWRFVWWINIPTSADTRRFRANSRCNERLTTFERNEELECRLRKAAPAHTQLQIGYSAVTTGLRFELPVHSEFATDRLRWADTTNGLGDVSDLLATPGTEEISRLQINGNGGDGSNFIQLRTLGGAELSPAFEGYATAVTLQAEGLEDMVMAGPGSALHDSSDATEPYQWVPGDDYANGSITYIWSGGQAAGLAAWVTDFKAAYAADNSIRAVLTLYDGT